MERAQDRVQCWAIVLGWQTRSSSDRLIRTSMQDVRDFGARPTDLFVSYYFRSACEVPERTFVHWRGEKNKLQLFASSNKAMMWPSFKKIDFRLCVRLSSGLFKFLTCFYVFSSPLWALCALPFSIVCSRVTVMQLLTSIVGPSIPVRSEWCIALEHLQTLFFVYKVATKIKRKRPLLRQTV
jgi:hypothetical protein